MPSSLRYVIAAGALCACAAPSIPRAAGPDNPADPAASTAPFVRPINVLAVADTPATASPTAPMDLSGPMAGMNMSSTAMSGAPQSTAPGETAVPAMPAMTLAQTAPAAHGPQAVGKVNTVDAASHMINLTHQPIKALGWPSMTMDFKVAPSVDINALKPGEAVTFTLGAPDADGNRHIERVEPR